MVTLTCMILLSTLSIIVLGTCLICGSASATINYHSINLSNNSGHSLNQKLTQVNGHIYLTWTDTSNSSSGKGQIFFSSSNNSGISFGNPLILSDQTDDANLPYISAHDKNVYVTWETSRAEDSRHILFRASSDSGKTFDNVLSISNDIVGSTLPNIGSFKNFVYVTWIGSNSTDPNNFEVFLRASHDYGKTFGPLIDLSKSPGDSIDPHIKVPKDGNDVYITYTDCDAIHDDPLCGIYFTKSSDNGITFKPPQLISVISPVDQHLPFLEKSQRQTIRPLLSESELGINIHKYPGEHNAVIPVITSSDDGKDVFILWQDDLTRTGATDIFFRKSNDYGNTFSNSTNLSNTSGVSRLPQMVAVGSDVYVVWSDTNMTFLRFDTFFTKITNHGNKIGKTINLSNSKWNSAPSDIEVVNNSNTIYVAWTDNIDINKNKIMISKSIDGGRTFELPIQLDSNNSFSPAMMKFTNYNNAGLTWTELGENNEDIYFAKID